MLKTCKNKFIIIIIIIIIIFHGLGHDYFADNNKKNVRALINQKPK
jgi:hypothetical protein